MNIDNILNQLHKVKKTGQNRWVACCPVHSEKTPSFSITQLSDRIICRCFGCGALAPQVIEALGLSWDDFFDKPLEHAKSQKGYVSFPAADILKALAFEANILALAASDIRHGVILSDNDYARLNVACDRINKAVSYMR